MLKLLRLPLAEQDLSDIWLYAFEKWGDVQADRYLRELGAAMNDLCKTPGLAKPRNEILQGLFSKLVNRHVIFCRIESDSLIVWRVLHERMDAEDHLLS
jgi:toxin ParE1/3/4